MALRLVCSARLRAGRGLRAHTGQTAEPAPQGPPTATPAARRTRRAANKCSPCSALGSKTNHEYGEGKILVTVLETLHISFQFLNTHTTHTVSASGAHARPPCRSFACKGRPPLTSSTRIAGPRLGPGALIVRSSPRRALQRNLAASSVHAVVSWPCQDLVVLCACTTPSSHRHAKT